MVDGTVVAPAGRPLTDMVPLVPLADANVRSTVIEAVVCVGNPETAEGVTVIPGPAAAAMRRKIDERTSCSREARDILELLWSKAAAILHAVFPAP